jgi:prolyl-tRNA synthetase
VAVIGRSSRLAHDAVKGSASYLDATGRMQPVCIALHQLDLGCLLAAAAEQNHDDHGLRLPPAAAPFQVHLVGMPGAEAEADALVDALAAEGITCLYDDRGESAGVKFTDADLIGLPLRITLGKRSLQAGGAEFKRRDQADKVIIPLGGVVQAVRAALAGAEDDIMDQIEELPYGEHLR